MLPEPLQNTFLTKLEELTPIPEAEFAFLCNEVEVTKISKNSKLVAEGELPTTIGWVISGLIKKQVSRSNGSIFIKDFSWEGEFVASYVAMLTGKPSEMDYIAIEDTEMLTIPYDKFVSFYDRHTCWERLGRKVAEKMFIIHEQRELDLLRYPPLELYEKMKQDLPHLTPRLKQAEIAAYLGITPESLSRLTKRRREKAKQ